MNGHYLTILQDSLRKKLDVLEEIQRICQIQSDILATEPIDFDKFDQGVDDKDICIEQLNRLDEGFEQLYERVSEELKAHKTEYTAWISETKKLIEQIMEKSVAIQAQEARNKQAVEAAFQKEKGNLGKGKKSMKAAMDYYRSMSKTNVNTSQFMDKKK